MTLEKCVQELRRIRAGSNSHPIKWVENELDRLVAHLERPDDELDSLMRGETLVSGGLTYRIEPPKEDWKITKISLRIP